MTTISKQLTRAACGVVAGGLALAIAAIGTPSSPLTRLGSLGAPMAMASGQLSHFADCDELRSWYVRQTLPRVTAWGLDYGGPMFAIDAGDTVRAEASASAPVVGNGPTGTNLQEVGVDEADLAKTYGEDFVISIQRHSLIMTDVSGPTPTVVGRAMLDDTFLWTQVLIAGDRAVVLGQNLGGEFGGVRVADLAYAPPSQTSMTIVSLVDPAAPVVEDERAFTGLLSAARAHDHTVRLVLSQAGVDLPFVQPGPDLGERAALRRNKALVEAAGLDAWLPRNVDAAARTTSALVDCSDVRHPAQGSGLGTITVLTVDPAAPEGLAKDAVAADGSLVYVSAKRLYVATVANGWLGWRDSTRDSKTASTSTVHAFAIDDAETPYVASGRVDGVIPDRWALSEHEGLLRVASTRGQVWDPLETTVTVLRERADRLVPIGAVGGLGKGEQITAVRWFGDLAVVVTFMQTDPLYTVDLADPTAPRVLGELKITGFSSYLHPLGGDLILGVGQAATRSGQTEGSQVSTFDLSETSRIQTLELGADYSPVEGDSRAFTYLPDLRVAIIPVTDWETGSSRLILVGIGDDGSLVQRRQIAVDEWSEQARALPLPGNRIAVTAGGSVQQIVQLG